jgi:hypothetical protein
MRLIFACLVLLLALPSALPSALPAAAQDNDSTPFRGMPEGPLAALKGGDAEYYLHAVPTGWSWQEVESEAPYHAITFLPEGQPRRGWTDALVLALFAGQAKPPQGLLVAAEREMATECRDLRRSDVETGVSEAGFDEAWQLLACRSKLGPGPETGRGEIQLLHAIQGRDSGYLIRRVWRTQSMDDGLPVGQETVEAARGGLRAAQVCRQDTGGRTACPPFTAMGLGSIETDKPYGVFQLQ